MRPRKFIVTSNYSIEECFPYAQDTLAILRRFECWYFQTGKQPVLVPQKTALEVANARFNTPATPMRQPEFDSTASLLANLAKDKAKQEEEEEEEEDELTQHISS